MYTDANYLTKLKFFTNLWLESLERSQMFHGYAWTDIENVFTFLQGIKYNCHSKDQRL